MKKNKLWFFLIAAWGILFSAYLVWWPPQPKGEIFALHPLPDQTCMVLQSRWKKGKGNPLILYRVDQELEIIWQKELPHPAPDHYNIEEAIWADSQQVYVCLPGQRKKVDGEHAYQILAYSLKKGEKVWETGTFGRPDPDNQWKRFAVSDEFLLAGADGKLFSFHHYINMEPGDYSHTTPKSLDYRAWDTKTGKLLWQRDDLRPDSLGKSRINGKIELDSPEWKAYHKADSLYRAYPEYLENAVLLPDHGLLMLQCFLGMRLWLDMETGETVKVIKNSYQGVQQLDGFYYTSHVSDSSFAKSMKKFDYATREEQEVVWWAAYQAQHPDLLLSDMDGIGQYAEEEVYLVEVRKEGEYRSYIQLMGVAPAQDSVTWTLALVSDSLHFVPRQYYNLEEKYPEYLPFNGQLDRFIPFYANITTPGYESAERDKIAFCLVDLEFRAFTETTRFNNIRKPIVFRKEGQHFIMDGETVLSAFDGLHGKLTRSVVSSGFLDLKTYPNRVNSGLIWATDFNRLVVLNAHTLEVIANQTDQDFSNNLEVAGDRLGLQIIYPE